MFDAIQTMVTNAISENQFFSGGLILGVLVAIGAVLRKLPGMIYTAVKRRVVVSAELLQTDDVFRWFCTWMASQPYSNRARRWVVFSDVKSGLSDGDGDAPMANGVVDTSHELTFDFVPAPGFHVFKHRGRWYWFFYVRQEVELTSGYRHHITLYTLGWDSTPLKAILTEAYEHSLPHDPKIIAVKTVRWGDWQLLDWCHPRPLTSLVFDNNIVENLLLDIRNFLSSEEWYRNMGIPWRRGYLLYGEPGNGKSSLVVAVSGELGMDIYVLGLTKMTTNERLRSLLMEVPAGSVILIEDIDTVFDEGKSTEEADTLSFSGFLNAIDGIATREGNIVFMTTNHKDILDPALIRPGRADQHFYIGNATDEQATRFFQRFFPGTDGLADNFGQGIGDQEISMAQIQEHLLQFRSDPVGAAQVAVEVAQ